MISTKATEEHHRLELRKKIIDEPEYVHEAQQLLDFMISYRVSIDRWPYHGPPSVALTYNHPDKPRREIVLMEPHEARDDKHIKKILRGLLDIHRVKS